MTFFLLTISFLLHVISFYLIYHLYVTNKQKEHKDYNKITQVFDTYLQEIKDENNRLLSYHKERQGETVEANKEQEQLTYKSNHLLQPKTDSNHLTDLINNNKTNDSVETSIHAKVLALYQSGMDVEEIAKKLNCGKTEAELIIKFYS
ncbi:hypothetical protein HNQ35_001085 [Cerasibacillus quisquiliarum]|uniref:Swarming motility protein SwrB n=1 Tax=Cerasibacillus quisquiliarum TaxID=227865 RepID=A0A511UV30_9BACI|nr:hypothetical protein [Cerasibacillus quisquiliarum]MBB5145884.1 hypothetical protein [Cerasibacillus quisquiliarum]GEN30455.1 hypothetical protein CQU01_06930 [Cerasibacillus quisquiliarum]